MNNKKWYKSKTVWVNGIAIVAFIAQTLTGKAIITPEVQAIILGGINLILRTITKENITW